MEMDIVVASSLYVRQTTATERSRRCGAPDRASILLDVCFCHPGWSGENCDEATPDRPPPCGPYDDRCHYHPAYGVAAVSEERWRSAQKFEDATWADERRTEDRNGEHAANFEGYATLLLEEELREDGQSENVFGSVMEFGAGPFTQSLTIFDSTQRTPHRITLLEPMAETYMRTVKACRYKDGTLGGLKTRILPIPAEDLVPSVDPVRGGSDEQYDTILLLNFVEHVRDAFRVYDVALRLLRPGGLVIFHERYWPGYDGVAKKKRREFDLHPIRLNERMAHWMSTEFDLLYEKEQDERWGNLGYYWIGRKRTVPMSQYVDQLRVKLDEHNALLAEAGWDETNVWGNIYNGRDLEQSREYMSYVRPSRVKTICEVGFAGGHSTIAYMTANPDAVIHSFDNFGKRELTQLAYDVLRKTNPNLHLWEGDSTKELPKFASSHPDVFCDVISVDGRHGLHYPDVDLDNFKYLANYPNVVLIDDYHEVDWPAVHKGAWNRVNEGSMKLRHVSASSIVFRNKQKQWAIGEYTLLTIVVMTRQLERIGGVKGILEVAAQHPVVQQIIVIWNGPDIPAEVSELERHPKRSARITVIHRQVNSLNNRYDPLLPVHTGAVMVLDDDLVISKETIDCAFGAWKRDPSQLYSFGKGRSVSAKGYDGYGGLPIGDAATNFLLPRMVFHRKFMSIYFDATNQALRDYVDEQEAHCDDIAFASVVTKYTQKPMKYVPAPWENTDQYIIGALHKQPRRKELRSECAKRIVEMLNWTLMAVEAVQC